MNNEIKFRVWDDDEKMMVYSDEYNLIHKFWEFVDRHIGMKEVQRFTGLKDKNGKEIYEGDIIRFFDEYLGDDPEEQTVNVCEVKFGEGFFDGGYYKYVGFYLVDSSGKVCEPHEITCLAKRDGEFKFEVIGNIHENPELLK